MERAELESRRQEAARRFALRLRQPDPGDAGRWEILICTGLGCLASGAGAVREGLERALRREGIADRVRVIPTGCMGPCACGPIVRVRPDGIDYVKVTAEQAEKIAVEHLKGGEPVESAFYRAAPEAEPVRDLDELSFFKVQRRIVLENCGAIDPESLDEYIGRDGYAALAKAIFDMDPSEIVAEVQASGLRGRGGAGFPTGEKWKLLARAPGRTKYVVCNADERDPGAFMDRSVLEGDPHRVIEGMAIAGRATGASKGFIYVRAEYPLAIRRLQIAIDRARAAGLLGRRILGSRFGFSIELRVGAGAFVCGEETALMASAQGERGTPRPRPPYPTDRGIHGRPTMINNVDTFANIPPIIRRGSAWFRSFGTEKSPGTKVFALAGKIKHSGLVEVPMGTSLRKIVFELGGGTVTGRPFKAAQTGGPSGGCIPAKHLDLPLDFDSLPAVGSIMGSGGLIVMDEETCMVDTARFFMEFCVDESCGKCPPCRVGTRQMLRMLDRITRGESSPEEIEELRQLAALVRSASLCGLGQTAPNPVLSTLRHFPEEYEAHIRDRTCPAKVCQALIRYLIELERCVGCGMCARKCPVDTIFRIDGQKKYRIEQAGCIRCGTCFQVCRFGAVRKE